MLIKQTVFISAKRSWNNEFEFSLFNGDMTQYGYINLGPIEVEFEVPDNFDMNAKEIEVLELAKVKAAGEYHSTIRRIEDQISKLRCLTYIPAEVEVV